MGGNEGHEESDEGDEGDEGHEGEEGSSGAGHEGNEGHESHEEGHEEEEGGSRASTNEGHEGHEGSSGAGHESNEGHESDEVKRSRRTVREPQALGALAWSPLLPAKVAACEPMRCRGFVYVARGILTECRRLGEWVTSAALRCGSL